MARQSCNVKTLLTEARGVQRGSSPFAPCTCDMEREARSVTSTTGLPMA